MTQKLISEAKAARMPALVKMLEARAKRAAKQAAKSHGAFTLSVGAL